MRTFLHSCCAYLTFIRYSLHLVDTIKVGTVNASLLTSGMKTANEVLFFLNAESEDEKPAKSQRKPPIMPRTNGSPAKAKTVGGKVLRNQSQRATQDEVHKTAAAKQMEHQRELHEKLHAEGLAKYSQEGDGAGGKEGKGWRKFQSYKGEGALPNEVEKLRVRPLVSQYLLVLTFLNQDLRRP